MQLPSATCWCLGSLHRHPHLWWAVQAQCWLFRWCFCSTSLNDFTCPHDFPLRYIPASTSIPGKPCSSKKWGEQGKNRACRDSCKQCRWEEVPAALTQSSPASPAPVCIKGCEQRAEQGFFIALSGFGGIALSGICLGVTCDSNFGSLTAHRN